MSQRGGGEKSAAGKPPAAACAVSAAPVAPAAPALQMGSAPSGELPQRRRSTRLAHKNTAADAAAAAAAGGAAAAMPPAAPAAATEASAAAAGVAAPSEGEASHADAAPRLPLPPAPQPRRKPLSSNTSGDTTAVFDISASARLREALTPGLSATPRRARRTLRARGLSAARRTWEEVRLGVDEIPLWMRDNDRIVSQYRPQLPWSSAAASLLTWHNETYNVWSHLVGFGIFSALLVQWLLAAAPPMVDVADACAVPPRWPIAVYLASCCYVYACSAAAHLFYVVSRRVNEVVWKLDHSAIAVNCTSGFAPICMTAFACSDGVAACYLSATVLLACGVGVASTFDAFHTDKWRVTRTLVQLSFPAWAMVPMAHAVQEMMPHAEASAGLRLVGASICVMVAGAVVFAARLTETLMPACVDLIGSSHNIMHTCVVVAHLIYFEGAMMLWRWRGGAGCVC